MADRAAKKGPAALDVRGLNVYYGASHALQGVNLTLESGVLSVVGRNGMGKTTLCKAIHGLVPVASGSISFLGQSLAGRTPAEISRMGIGYVPQGRRLWRSLTVDEHLKMVEKKGGAWRSSASIRPSRVWPNGSQTGAGSFRAASSRCWQSRARSCRTLAFS
jgi:ABC-type branched-subunit amino acid transport system ATPase component